MELSSLVNRWGSTLSTSVLSFKLIILIVIENSKKYNFSIIMIGIEMKLNIPVHYQMGNPLQQDR
jgi:hypothetical protein